MGVCERENKQKAYGVRNKGLNQKPSRTMINEGSRSQPELGTLFPRGIHDAKVIFTCPQKALVFLCQFRNVALQKLQLVILLPGGEREKNNPIDQQSPPPIPSSSRGSLI